MIVDLRDQLPRADWEIGRFSSKQRLLFHWAGTPVRQSRPLPETIRGFARYHIDKDWNPDLPGVQGGDGLHYHFVLGDDVVYQARDLDAVLWASGTDANRTAWHALFPVGEGQSPTLGMYRAAAWLHRHLAVPAGGHRDEGTSTCPGDEIAAWIPKEEAVDLAELDRRIDAKIAEYGARLQPELEVDRKRIDTLETRVNSIDIAGEHDHEIPVMRTGGPAKR